MSMVAQVVSLSPAQLPEAGAMLASAFHDDPLTRFLLPQAETRDRWLRLVMGATLRQVLPEGHVYTITGQDVSGVVGLVPPGRYPLPIWRNLRFMFRVGMLPPPFGPS